MFRPLLLTALVAAAPAAADTYTGKGMGTAMNKMMPIADGHIVMQTFSEYESFEVSDDHPLKGASGPCIGSLEINAGAVSGSGKCVYTTAEGEMAVMNWMAKGLSAEGAVEGDWTVSGGTGKWAGASGGGTFSSLTNPDTGKFVNDVTGEFNFN